MRLRIVLACCAFWCACFAAGGDGFVPLFDGKTLSGWINPSGQGKSWVEEGEIRMLGEQPFFLLTERRFGDFVLEAELLVPDGCNSGIQFRTQVQQGKVWGYQAEVDTSERRWTGGLYDQGRRAWLGPLEGKPEAQAAYTNNGWNQIRVECVRDRIRIFVNDVLTTDYIDSEDIEGHIGLQNHGRFKAEEPLVHRFRNIRVKNLGRRKWLPLWDGRSLKGWRSRPATAWRIESGALAGAGNQGSLISSRSYSDFSVRVQFKLIDGDAGFCFGVADAKGASPPRGFLVPIGNGSTQGGLTETGRDEPLVRPLAPPQKAAASPPDGWRWLSVSTHGRRVVVHLDGRLTSELHEAQKELAGRLALQLDTASRANRVEVKRIEILGEPAR